MRWWRWASGVYRKKSRTGDGNLDRGWRIFLLRCQILSSPSPTRQDVSSSPCTTHLSFLQHRFPYARLLLLLLISPQITPSCSVRSPNSDADRLEICLPAPLFPSFPPTPPVSNHRIKQLVLPISRAPFVAPRPLVSSFSTTPHPGKNDGCLNGRV
ncbi:hypothetical protein ASPBRDRAFT_230050 [Aspergillus brasiliensis CBS 101740]|uniref:Uncharacterized protein n=1 Tax=Aspergillus brasiliensis (strain CBS 101740 / IMI 381727 / IBT 21946) TaxID=767769 RepID=A0A1L9UZS7_ASPBC|nr:hypothetical protein ASPBRDRAFT_230050 [Aspergillus brasiliensis CBS 101740]